MPVTDPPLPAVWGRDHPRRAGGQSPVTSLTWSAQQQAVAEHIAVVISDITDHTRGQQGASRPAGFPRTRRDVDTVAGPQGASPHA